MNIKDLLPISTITQQQNFISNEHLNQSAKRKIRPSRLIEIERRILTGE